MKRKAEPKNVMLGKGVFSIDQKPIGLTRDGGKFTVEYEYREVTADGDRGKVKGRILKEGATPKIELNHLELLTDFDLMHTGLKSDKSTEQGFTVYSGTGKIDDAKDYHTVTFEGETLDHKQVFIEIKDAINLENLELELKDKNEVIDKITFTGTYEENAEDEYDECWILKYKTA